MAKKVKKAEELRNSKPYIVFYPQKLQSFKNPFELRQWIATPQNIISEKISFNQRNLFYYIQKASESSLKALSRFEPSYCEMQKDIIVQQLSYLPTKMQRDTILKSLMMKNHQKEFITIRQNAADFNLYHSSGGQHAKGGQLVRCGFHSFTVELSFAFIQNKLGVYDLKTNLQAGKIEIPYTECRRFSFLVENNNIYHQLSASSYEAIEWLETKALEFYTLDAMIEAADMLRQKGLKAEMPTHKNQSLAVAEPELQIFLSELNNSFLKLEPQFIYDGYLAEGLSESILYIADNGGQIEIQRNLTQEKKWVNELSSLHPKFASQGNGFFYLTFAEAQHKNWFLKTYHKLVDSKIALTGLDMLKHFRYSPLKPVTELQFQNSSGDWITASFALKFGKETITTSLLQKTLLNGQKTLMLKDGSLGVLQEEWMLTYHKIIVHAKEEEGKLLIPRWLLLSHELIDEDGDGAFEHGKTLPKDLLLQWKQWQENPDALFPLPAGLAIQRLRPYQQKGYEWMRLLSQIGGSACLADDMGLGKTLQTIAFLLYKLEIFPASKHLVVAPASLIYSWQDELKKFAPAIKSFVFHGSKRNKEELADDKIQIIITSYGTFRQDSHLFLNNCWDAVVMDESHSIKNPSAQITRLAWQIKAHTRIALSGTPVMNSTEDLYGQFQYLLPGLLGTKEFFKKEYTIPIQADANSHKAKALKLLLNPFILRRTKAQAAPDLPLKTETVIWCDMDEEQQLAYETMKEQVRSTILGDIKANGLAKGKLSVLAGLTKLRQLCNSCELLKENNVSSKASIKSKLLLEELSILVPQHKVLIFSQFTSMLDLLERDIGLAGIPFLRLDGQTNALARSERVADFQKEDSKTSVFLISLKAGGAGLTLTQADYVFIFDPWWNAAVESQAIDRTHRIGQHKPVFAYRMICKGTIEEKIIVMAGSKKKIAEELITVDDGFVKDLTIEDINYLLS